MTGARLHEPMHATRSIVNVRVGSVSTPSGMPRQRRISLRTSTAPGHVARRAFADADDVLAGRRQAELPVERRDTRESATGRCRSSRRPGAGPLPAGSGSAPGWPGAPAGWRRGACRSPRGWCRWSPGSKSCAVGLRARRKRQREPRRRGCVGAAARRSRRRRHQRGSVARLRQHS